MTEGRKASFTDHPSWIAYRTILEEEFSITFACEPKESWEEIRGHSIRIDQWEPEGQAKGTMILVHGGGGSGRILAPTALPALASGWRVIAPDLPGYGLTVPAKGYRGEYADWPLIIAAIADATPGPVVLMGMSLGGLTAVFAAQAAKAVDGVIATTLVDPTDPATFDRVARWPWLGAVTRFAIRWMPGVVDRIPLPLAFATPLRAMTSNARLQGYFVKDRLLGARWVPARFFRLIHQQRLESNELKCPIALIHPGSDTWTPTAMSRPVFDRLETEKTLIELSNGTHLPLEQPAFEELGGAIAAFLKAREKPENLAEVA